jgi:hypothetical protein
LFECDAHSHSLTPPPPLLPVRVINLFICWKRCSSLVASNADDVVVLRVSNMLHENEIRTVSSRAGAAIILHGGTASEAGQAAAQAALAAGGDGGQVVSAASAAAGSAIVARGGSALEAGEAAAAAAAAVYAGSSPDYDATLTAVAVYIYKTLLQPSLASICR